MLEDADYQMNIQRLDSSKYRSMLSQKMLSADAELLRPNFVNSVSHDQCEGDSR